MTCIMCGDTAQSEPQVESNWRLVEVDGQPYYICPAEFPPDDATEDAFAAAYQAVFEKIDNIN